MTSSWPQTSMTGVTAPTCASGAYRLCAACLLALCTACLHAGVLYRLHALAHVLHALLCAMRSCAPPPQQWSSLFPVDPDICTSMLQGWRSFLCVALPNRGCRAFMQCMLPHRSSLQVLLCCVGHAAGRAVQVQPGEFPQEVVSVWVWQDATRVPRGPALASCRCGQQPVLEYAQFHPEFPLIFPVFVIW